MDQFDLSRFSLPKITAVVPTYNRSPHTAKEDANPLGWCLESLLAQKGDVLDEIIVMDDASTDFTEEVVEDFQGKSNIDIRYFKNKKNLGSSKNKNRAARESKNNSLIFLDDDCIFSNYFIFGAGFTMDKLPENAAALHMPVYHRKISPGVIDASEIGKLDLAKGVMTGNHGAIPKHYFEDLESHFLDSDMSILNPIEIANLAGIFLTKKDLFEKIGNYPEFLNWKNGYREEAHVSINFKENGYGLYLTPDPKFHSIHLKYGSKGEEKAEELRLMPPKLKRLIDYSSVERDNTGNRVDSEEWFFSRIISTYVTLGIRNREAAKNYLVATEDEFVNKNELAVSGFGKKIEDLGQRKRIFDRAVTEGNKLLEKRVI